jgi:putative transposase
MKANQAETERFAVRTMSRVLGVSASGYYARQNRSPSARTLENAALTERIKEIHAASDEIYGMPKICRELGDETDVHFDERWSRVSPNRVARLMRQAGLRGVSRRRSFTVTTERDEKARPAPDLVNRQFVATGPNKLWVSDITYVPTWAGFIYLAIVLDTWSRKVVGWSIGEDLRATLVIAALDMAYEQRKAYEVIHHSDQGSQYTSVEFGKRCNEMGVKPSMGTVGDAYDNAMAESFFATLECELIDRRVFKSKAEARTALFAYIEGWYNPRRRHGSIGYVAPVEFERRHAPIEAAGLIPLTVDQTGPAGLENPMR